ncbi:hypothetical protein FC223_25125 [Escherichia coli]|nr:hypothetical protein [Escherichia coli]EFI8702969.1 hypothetical protein [Escherichia coli]
MWRLTKLVIVSDSFWSLFSNSFGSISLCRTKRTFSPEFRLEAIEQVVKYQRVKPDVRSALQNLVAAFNHCNENYPHRTLGCRSPREYRRQRIMLT